MLKWTFSVLLVFTIGWVVYIQLLIHSNIGIQLTIIETIRKLFNYPKIYEKVVLPMFILKIHYEVLMALGGFILVFLYKEEQTKNKTIGFILLILLFCFCTTGLADTLYNHIRYFYYLYPLLLTFIAAGIALVWLSLRRNILKVAFVSCLSVFFIFQIWISWEMVVNASPGNKERFSYGEIYLDQKTCANYLNKHVLSSDFVIFFSSSHQAAVYYKGKIDAALKPKLKQYQSQEYHYITGAKFFMTKEKLASLVKEHTNNETTIWIFIDRSYNSYGFWVKEFFDKINNLTVCKASDQNLSLIRMSGRQFHEYFDSIKPY